MSNPFPRTLFEWLKSDDKLLLAGLASGQSVLEIAEDLGREHISVLRRIDALGLFCFEQYTEEWVEFMGLSLAGVPLQAVIDWCSAAPARMAHEDLEALAMGDLRPEFELARNLEICVPTSESITDLSWLAAQPLDVQQGYSEACASIIGDFDMVTPLTLKNKVLGIVPALPARTWPARASVKAGATTKRRAGAKRYRRRSSASKSRSSKSGGGTFKTYGEIPAATTRRRKSRSASRAW